MSKWWAVVVLLIAGLLGGTWYLYTSSPQAMITMLPQLPGLPVATPAASDMLEGRSREVTLFVSDASGSLTRAIREIEKREEMLEEVTQTITLLIQPDAEARNAAFPEGTELLNVFLSQGGILYLNMNRNLQDRHVGGLNAELATVTALINTILLNFQAIKHVQILVEGTEIDTLAGHIDCRKPFSNVLLLDS